MKIKANGIAFDYRIDGGEGSPWLILSNSLATDPRMWDEQAEQLKSAFCVLRYDRRGHGQTAAPASRSSTCAAIRTGITRLRRGSF